MATDYRVLVLGDESIDWHIIKTQASAQETVSWQTQGGNVAARAGGAKLLSYLIKQCLQYDVLPYDETAVGIPMLKFTGGNALPLIETMTICAPQSKEPKSEDTVYRVEKLCGFRQPAIPSLLQSPGELDQAPDVIVIDDAGNGIRTQIPVVLAILKSLPAGEAAVRPWLIIKVAWRILDNPLLIELVEQWGRRLIIVAPVDDLRRDEIQLSRGLSWERTAQDLSWEFHYNPRMRVFADAHALVVPIGLSGVWYAQHHTHTKRANAIAHTTNTLVFDPACIEGDWEKDRPGILLGYTSCLTMALVREFASHARPNLHRGTRDGLSVMRALHTNGYVISEATGTLELPLDEMQAALKTPKTFHAVSIPIGYRRFSVPTGGQANAILPPSWSILNMTHPSPSELLALGVRIVKKGTECSLGNIPFARFGGVTTVDKNEIEAYRTAYALIKDYCGNSTLRRPLSLAVFGPPGSGKSYAVVQIANAVDKDAIEKITFNVSQFTGPDDLIDAFHRVRDIGLRGKIPLVFWDEFDSTHHGQVLYWLKAFLAPMQDGEFTQGQINHPIGRAIFVFAGGTAKSVDELGTDMSETPATSDLAYRSAKVPDFKSRLRGCINIVGIDRRQRQRTDERFFESDPQYVVRRAIILRSIIERTRKDIFNSEKEANIDDGLLKALLSVWAFTHGVRSLESIIELCHIGDQGALHRSSLPPRDVLALHVNTREFLGLITADVDFPPAIVEKLAKAHHEIYRQESPDTELGKLSYTELDKAGKDLNRDAVKGIPHKLASIGYMYALRPASAMPPPEPLPEKEAEYLARLEHDRWIVTKIDAGFVYAEEPNKDGYPHTHRDLVPWDDLESTDPTLLYPPTLAAKMGRGPLMNQVDIKLARHIPAIMHAAGFRVYKL